MFAINCLSRAVERGVEKVEIHIKSNDVTLHPYGYTYVHGTYYILYKPSKQSKKTENVIRWDVETIEKTKLPVQI